MMTVERQKLLDFIEACGADPNDIMRVNINPREVVLRGPRYDALGRIQLTEDREEILMDEHYVAII